MKLGGTSWNIGQDIINRDQAGEGTKWGHYEVGWVFRTWYNSIYGNIVPETIRFRMPQLSLHCSTHWTVSLDVQLNHTMGHVAKTVLTCIALGHVVTIYLT